MCAQRVETSPTATVFRSEPKLISQRLLLFLKRYNMTDCSLFESRLNNLIEEKDGLGTKMGHLAYCGLKPSVTFLRFTSSRWQL